MNTTGLLTSDVSVVNLEKVFDMTILSELLRIDMDEKRLFSSLSLLLFIYIGLNAIEDIEEAL